jgi:hypothetical protein
LSCGKGAIPTEKGKRKTIPLQASTGTEIFRKFRLPDFKIIGT